VGILNVTPDSFYDGGRYVTELDVLARVEQMIEQGADIVDVGGQSTRPEAKPVSLEEEITRVIPRIESICNRFAVPISVDTYRADIAERALDVGAELVNDVSALRFDHAMASVIARYGAYVVLMHLKGKPRSMQNNPQYTDVMTEIVSLLSQQIGFAHSQGIDQERIIVDPGIGFGKNVEHNLVVLRNISRLKQLHSPILVGASRKSFMGQLFGIPPPERMVPSIAAACIAVVGGARLIRCHDVNETRYAVDLVSAVLASADES